MTRRFRTRAPSLLTRGAARGARAIASLWFSGPLHRALLGGGHPLKMLGTIDPETLNSEIIESEIGTALLDGRYPAGGQIFEFEADRFWELAGVLPGAALGPLHSFDWLDRLASAVGEGGETEARRLAERATEGWIKTYGDWDGLAWRADVTGRRLMSWIVHSGLVLASGDMIYRSAVLESMSRQARHLRWALITAPPGPGRVSAAAGLVTTSILLPGLEGKRKAGLTALQRALRENVLADGSPLTRNPADLERIILELITVKASFAAVTLEPPAWLQSALDRALPALLALGHGDHLRAQFNGAFAGDGPLSTVLADATDAHGRAPVSLPRGGYERLKRQRTCIIVDVGQPPPGRLSAGHHAAPLALEFSDGKDRIVVNIGGSIGGSIVEDGPAVEQADSLAAMCRTTAAHSTLIIGDTNAAEIRPDGEIGDGPVSVDVTREENEDGTWLTASHDGYVRKWRATHKRSLYLNAAGTDFRGEDALLPENTRGPGRRYRRKNEPTLVDIRFHLHPAISASMTRDGGAIILRLPHGHGWLFRGHIEGGGLAKSSALATIEDSLYVPTPEAPVKSAQIVLSGAWPGSGPGNEVRFSWSFRRMDSKD